MDAPNHPVAGEVHLEIRADGPVDWRLADRHGRGGPGGIDLPLQGLPSGVHPVTVRAGGLLRSTAVTVELTVDHTAPALDLGRTPTSVEQGHTLPVTLTLDEPGQVTLTVLGRQRVLHEVDGTHRALVGIPIRTPAGPLALELTTEDALGNQSRSTVALVVESVDWPFTGKLPLSRKKANVPSEAVQRMRDERDPVYAENPAGAHWTGVFQLPVRGRHTSAFGTYREYPDGRRSHHDAEDIGAKPWTPVVAAGSGIVSLARMQAVHGNAVLLTHGHGVVSLYSHLAGLDVTEGQRVEAGQRLGWVGSTGRSTGPHLHWGVVVDQVPVDPMQWLETDFSPAGLSDRERPSPDPR